MGIEFNVLITDEACTHAAIANSKSGWYLSPSRWEASSDSSGDITEEVIIDGEKRPKGQTMTYNSRHSAFFSSPFSGVTPKDNTLLHSVIFPPDIDGIDGREIKEIYFIYKDMYGNEFLYAVAQPKNTTIKYTYGTRQQFLFSFSINPTVIGNTYIIDYTYPQDIEDHNINLDAHDYLLARDGSRSVTDILTYANPNDFTKSSVSSYALVDKNYVTLTNLSTRNYADRVAQNTKTDIISNYCPIGMMMWWPQSSLPSNLLCDINGKGGNWMVREGQRLKISDFTDLFAIIGHTYDPQNIEDYFYLPDDQGLFIRGYNGISFGQKQQENCEVVIPYDGWTCASGHPPKSPGKIKGRLLAASGRSETSEYLESVGATKASQISYGTNIRPENRNYLPIIRVK